MSDSCSPSKLDPGFAATYSIPSDLITSTMKSEPGFSMIRVLTCAGLGVVSAASWASDGCGAVAAGAAPRCARCAFAAGAVATSAAAPAAAPFRKPRRLREAFFFATVHSPIGSVLQRSEEHTSELQSRLHLVCRLLLEKKKSVH